MGWETIQLTSAKHRGGGQEEEEINGFRFYRSHSPNGWVSKMPVFDQIAIVQSLAKRLPEVIEATKPDILHAHSPALNGLAALCAARRYGLPVVYECRAFWEDAAVDHGTSWEGGIRYRASRALETFVLRKAQAVTTICEGLRKEIIARRIPENKVTIVANAVDIERFQFNSKPNPALRETLGLNGKTVLGFIGSFYAYEGLELLLETVPDILRMHPKIQVLLIGGGPAEEKLKSKVRALGITEQVTFVGRVPHDDVNDYYNQVDIFVYPRLSMRLTELVTPLKLLEAMAQGRLVVASNVGGHKELIESGKTGLLFQSGNRESLVATVLTLLNEPDAWPAMRAAGRRFVEQERNWKQSVECYRGVYGSLKNGSV